MKYRVLDLTLISATGLINASELDVYAVVSYNKFNKFKTSIYKNGGSDPKWDYRMRFTVDEEQKLVFEIKAVKMFFDKKLGEVKVPVKELLENEGNKGKQFVSYELKPNNGVVKFSYKFGEKSDENFIEDKSGSGCGTCFIVDCGGGGGAGCDGGGCGGCGCGGC